MSESEESRVTPGFLAREEPRVDSICLSREERLVGSTVGRKEAEFCVKHGKCEMLSVDSRVLGCGS